MNAERLAEIRLMAKYCTLDIGDAFRELLDHIDGLKFANGVLDSAAKDAQTWSYEAQTAKEAYCELLEANRVMEAEGGAIAQLNRMIDELRAQLEAQRGGAVVVPDLSSGCVIRWWNEMADKNRHCHWDSLDDSEKISATREYIAKHMATVLASQVLQPGEVVVKWISVSDRLPEDGETVGFITECSDDRWYHGRVLGGRYRTGEFGGFSVPGLTVQASHWFRFPAIPDAIRSQAGGEG